MVILGTQNWVLRKTLKWLYFQVLLLGSVSNQMYLNGFCTPDILVDEKVPNSSSTENYCLVCMICGGFRNAESGAKKTLKWLYLQVLLLRSVSNQMYLIGFCTPDILVDEKVLNFT